MIFVFAPMRRILKQAFVAVLAILLVVPGKITAQQNELADVTVATAVGNLAYSAVWVAEQLKCGRRSRLPAAGRHASRRSWVDRHISAPRAPRAWCSPNRKAHRSLQYRLIIVT
jgi:hypothetical protein